jgi:DUF4097 and DUF4098 domain-containing protein YvlB
MEQNVKEVRLLVLNILKEGRITIDEAEKIINVVSQFEELTKDKSFSTYIQNIPTEAIADFAREGVSKIEKLVTGIGNNIEKVAQNIGQKITTRFEPSGTSTHTAEKFNFSEQEEILLATPIENLNIENNWGGIKITGEERENILLHIEKIIWIKTQEQANERAKNLKIVPVFNGKKLQIQLPKVNPALNDIINLEIKVPSSLEFELFTTSGDINIQDVHNPNKNLIIKSNSGDIEVKQADYKSFEIMTISGDVSLKDVSGTINVRTTSGATEIEGNIFNDSRITTISGDIRGEAYIHDCIEISSSSGNIELKQHKNNESKLVDLVTNSGHIVYKGIVQNALRARSNSGEIKGNSIVTNSAAIEISTTSGDIEWKVDEDSSLTFICESKSGDIFTNLEIEGESISKTHDSLNGKIKEGTAKLLITTVSGDLKFHKE